MSFKFEYRDSHGRKVSEREWLKGFETGVMEAAKDTLEKKIRQVRCPVHGSTVTSITTTKQGDNLQFEYECCCDELKEKVGRAC
jgi:hypothetical protein